MAVPSGKGSSCRQFNRVLIARDSHQELGNAKRVKEAGKLVGRVNTNADPVDLRHADRAQSEESILNVDMSNTLSAANACTFRSIEMC
jgi:hypothetical protein